MFVKENREHCGLPLYLISDQISAALGCNGLYVYHNTDPYYLVWINAIREFCNVCDKYFIYLQEDFILYDAVNISVINAYVNFLEENRQYSFVRLLRSGRCNGRQLSDTLYEIEQHNPNIFAMQATLWRCDDYIRLMDVTRGNGWLETDAPYRRKMIDLNMMGVYHYDGENKRGRLHYDSNVYPYIATALVRGKWNVQEYPVELNLLSEKYQTDFTQRL
jgi:hypothetical protein